MKDEKIYTKAQVVKLMNADRKKQAVRFMDEIETLKNDHSAQLEALKQSLAAAKGRAEYNNIPAHTNRRKRQEQLAILRGAIARRELDAFGQCKVGAYLRERGTKCSGPAAAELVVTLEEEGLLRRVGKRVTYADVVDRAA